MIVQEQFRQKTPPSTHNSSESDEETSRIIPKNRKLKNELCRNYVENGFCKYHNKCQFAHGIIELRQNQSHNNKYKTKKCLSYFKKGYCVYGDRCNFSHKDENNFSEGVEWGRLQTRWKEIFLAARTRSALFSSI